MGYKVIPCYIAHKHARNRALRDKHMKTNNDMPAVVTEEQRRMEALRRFAALPQYVRASYRNHHVYIHVRTGRLCATHKNPTISTEVTVMD